MTRIIRSFDEIPFHTKNPNGQTWRWSLEIKRIPTNNQEANDEDITSRSLYCPLDDLDMLYLQENFVMTQLLHKSFFDEELTRIREKAIEKGHQVMTKKELFEPFGGEL